MKDAPSSARVARSSSNVGSGNGVSGGGGSADAGGAPKLVSTRPFRLFLKLGLLAMAAFHFAWVGKQLSALGTHGAYEDLFIAPEYTNEHSRDLSASSKSPFDPRGRKLPSHPSPNAELQELVSSHTKYDCPEGLVYVDDHILPDNVTHPMGRKIPRLFHITAKSRCMTEAFAWNVEKWKTRLGSKYSIYIHDDEAVNKFIYQKRWMEFPDLKEAAKADIWRYIMVWEYGGVYSDMDSSPNKFDVDSITDADDAFFPLEMLGIPAQYWFAASPRHPVMYLSARHALMMMAFRDDISNNNAAKTTGPGAYKTGFILFQQFAGIDTNGYVDEGLYTGAHGRTVRVVGSKANANQWIIREGVKGKGGNYKQMGMTHFHSSRGRFKELHQNQVVGCLDQRYKMHVDFAADWVNIV